MPANARPFFHAFGGPAAGRRFCLLHEPEGGSARGAVVYAHPFAEEMNKSRRMATLGSRALAARGFAVLQLDLHGCGDSDGHFSDASWSSWVDDVCAGMGWLADRFPAPRWFWGLRSGALLASEAARRTGDAKALLLWQPVIQGRQALQQFLRLRSMGDFGDGPKVGVDDLRRTLQEGAAVDVAGYVLPPSLALPLEESRLLPLADDVRRVVWLETSARAEPELLPASRQAVATIETTVTVTAKAVPGPSFWQTVEIEDVPALVDATVDAVLDIGQEALV